MNRIEMKAASALAVCMMVNVSGWAQTPSIATVYPRASDWPQFCTYSAQQHEAIRRLSAGPQRTGQPKQSWRVSVFKTEAGGEVVCTTLSKERFAPDTNFADKQDRGLVVQWLRPVEN